MVIFVELLSSLLYLAFPVIFTIVNGKIERAKARKYALLNSIILAIVLTLFTVLIMGDNAEFSKVMFLPAFFYYYIAKAIMTKKKQKD